MSEFWMSESYLNYIDYLDFMGKFQQKDLYLTSRESSTESGLFNQISNDEVDGKNQFSNVAADGKGDHLLEAACMSMSSTTEVMPEGPALCSGVEE